MCKGFDELWALQTCVLEVGKWKIGSENVTSTSGR
jgi:hypothetical protein